MLDSKLSCVKPSSNLVFGFIYSVRLKKKKKVFEDFLLLSNLLHGQTCCQQQSCCRACVEKDTRTALIDVLLRAGSGYRADARSRFLMELPGQSAGPRAQAAAKINTK